MTTICVTGMHRSGTSFVARSLQLLGVSLGDPDQLMRPGPDNPVGYWENEPIKQLDDELLADLGGSWDQPPVLAPGWEGASTLDARRTEARGVLERAFGDELEHGTIAWKDPRLSLLLPFWATVTPIDATLVVVRDPDEVAASLARRNAIEAPQAAVLWLRYLLAAVEHPRALVVDQAAFFTDLPATLDRIADHVGVDRPTPERRAAIADHLDPSLLHGAPSTRADDPLSHLARRVFHGGAVELDAIGDALTRQALAEGWLRPPQDGEQLAQARAKVMKLQATLRRRGLQKKKLDALREAGGAAT